MTGTDPTPTLRQLRERTIAPSGGARRKTTYLTQDEVAEAAGLDRSLYNNLERALERPPDAKGPRREITARYAAALEPILGADVWALVTVPPLAEGEQPSSVLALLRSLEARIAELPTAEDLRRAVASLQEAIDPQASRGTAEDPPSLSGAAPDEIAR